MSQNTICCEASTNPLVPSDAGHADGEGDVLDYRETPLNACSIETFCQSRSRDEATGSSSISAPSFIPLCLGCYQLNESTGKREGQLDLYAVPVRENSVDCIETFDSVPPLTIMGNGNDETTESPPGVLDGKWSNHPGSRLSCTSGDEDDNYDDDEFQNYYSTAHANGEIWIHDIRCKSSRCDATEKNPFEAKLAGKSVSPSLNDGLCLALAWENPLYSINSSSSNDRYRDGGVFETRIISSYSDGYTAIHKVRGRPPSPLANTNEIAQFENATTPLEVTLEHHWESHKIFTCPAEVWCANFIDSNTVVTGGDDASWKIWDLRQPLLKPIHFGRDDFDAGVTVLSPHPRYEKLLAIGSYDETVALFDLRQLGNKRPEALYHSDSLGGGIWRCKWHPFEDDKLLVGAMHGGCAVGKFQGLSSTPGREMVLSKETPVNVEFEIYKRFTLHKSMAYGIDWLATRHEALIDNTGVDVAASCSFYDKAMYLWKADSR